MRYLCIANHGETDPRSFTMLGVSGARGDSAKIGQFGSGVKHSILIALRAKLDITIISGQHVIRPYAEDVIINNDIYERVFFNIDGTAEPSSMTLDFGELDWATEIPSMLRELISNALDAVDQEWRSIGVSIQEKIETCDNETRVYIELRPDVRKAYHGVQDMFLHATGKHRDPFVRIEEQRPTRVYRKGVFVKEGSHPALYDYNCGEELAIDEARKLDSGNLEYICARRLFTTASPGQVLGAVETILRTGLIERKEMFEHHFSYYSLHDPTVGTVMKRIFGENVVITDSTFMFERAAAKGYIPILFPQFMHNWYQAAENYCKTAAQIMDMNIESFQQVTEIDPSLVHKVIKFLINEGLVKERELPVVYSYKETTEGGQITLGYTDGKSIYLSELAVTNLSTILEEVVHYCTGAQDISKDFQDKVVSIAAHLMELVL